MTRARPLSFTALVTTLAPALAAMLFSCGSAVDPPARSSTAPAATVTPWQPRGVSSPSFESHPAFDPRTADLYFVRSSPKFEGWRILVSACGADGARGQPVSPPFAGRGVEADPFFTADGRSLYYISTRARGTTASADLDIWRVDRDARGAWQTPVRLPEPINSAAAEWFPRPSPDGWLYFGSNRPGGQGKNDIWRARVGAGGQWRVENLGPSVNSAGDEYEPLPSPDGRRLLINADVGYFESRASGAGWSPRTRLPAEVNRNGGEVGAVFSPTGRSLLFSRDTRGPLSGELFLWRPDGDEPWPPACPVAAARDRDPAARPGQTPRLTGPPRARAR